MSITGPGQARSSCPGHDGTNPETLSVRDTADRVNLHCHAERCDSDAIMAAIGLEWRDRYHENRRENIATYRYDDGRTVYRKRTEPKAFRQSGTSGPPTLYRLAGVRAAVAEGRPVYLVEGEEDVHALETVGATATTAPQGAANFAKVDAAPLRGASVVAVVDRDASGDKWAASVRDKLAGVAASVRFVCAASGKDAADHLTAGHALAEFLPYEAASEPQEAAEAPGEAPGRMGAEELHRYLVGERVRALRVDRDARAALAREGRTPDAFDAGTLAEVLARPAEPAARVEGLIPWAASVLIVAQRKAGKTTLVLNLARALLTAAAFLGSLAVRPVSPGARVAILNYEVSGAQLARWADEVGVPVERLFRSTCAAGGTLDHPEDRAALAALLRANSVETLIVDPFGRAYSGASQNDAGEVGAWLVALDTFARAEVGARDLILTAHAGWNGERTRGSSALEDWADSIITLTKDEDTGDRFLRANGRDVDMDEDRLSFDALTRALTLTGDGSRKKAGAGRQDAETVAAILDALEDKPEGVSGEDLQRVTGRKDAALTRVRDALVKDGTLAKERRPGRGGGFLYRLNTEPPEPPENPPSRDVLNPPNPPLLPGGSDTGGLEGNPPSANTGRTCAECDQPIAPGKVRCPEHLAAMHRGNG
ncbi:MAG: AAA family ATPase [Nigerium sp.]|nr:AAA family ATPase [Nigerium sp.]